MFSYTYIFLLRYLIWKFLCHCCLIYLTLINGHFFSLIFYINKMGAKTYLKGFL
jgi:hypothetical protein